MPKSPWRTTPLIPTLWRSTHFCIVCVRVCSCFETLELNSNLEYLSSHEAEVLANLYNGRTVGEFLRYSNQLLILLRKRLQSTNFSQ